MKSRMRLLDPEICKHFSKIFSPYLTAADEGKTATSTKKRKDFLRMIKACEKGKVDLIITKSVSRFCRNTLDGLDYVRRLKRMGVGVFFEKENVNTLYMDNEMILTFMMSQAQAESESMSGNIRWGHRKN